MKMKKITKNDERKIYCPYCDENTIHTFLGYDQDRAFREFMFWYSRGFNEMLVNTLWECKKCGYVILLKEEEIKDE